MKSLNKIAVATVICGGLMSTIFVAQADNKSHTEDALALSTYSISMNKALEIAVAAVPGSPIEAEFEVEDGRSIWEVEVLDAKQQKHEIEIDATSGEVLKQELDDDND